MLHKIQSFFNSSIHQLKFFCLLLVLPCMVIQCNIDDLDPDNGNGNKEKLPPATHTGENTFGCKVNGKVWVPEAPPNIYELHADYYQDEFFVSARKRVNPEKNYTGIHIRIDSAFQGKGFYHLKSNIVNKMNNYGTFSNIAGNCDYGTDSFNTGKLEITHFDSSKRIVSGRFHFTAVLEQGDCKKDTIRITEGRFDIQN